MLCVILASKQTCAGLIKLHHAFPVLKKHAALDNTLNCWQDDRSNIVFVSAILYIINDNKGCHNKVCRVMGLLHPKQMDAKLNVCMFVSQSNLYSHTQFNSLYSVISLVAVGMRGRDIIEYLIGGKSV